MNEKHARDDLVDLTAELVAAYVGSNSVQRSDVPGLIESVYTALAGLGAPTPEAKSERPTPPISIKKSIHPDFLVSMEDGRRYKSLKRHLSGRGLTPGAYREKWGLPPDYPMVAANYTKQRSDLARAMGLGRKPETPRPNSPERADSPDQPAEAGATRKRGRKRAG